jgi:hypothetical protein
VLTVLLVENSGNSDITCIADYGKFLRKTGICNKDPQAVEKRTAEHHPRQT